MAILADAQIKKAVASGRLTIEGYEETRVQPASYDCGVGRVLLAGRGIVNPRKEVVRLRMGDWAEIETSDVFKLPADICATYGLRSTFTRKGLSWYGGPQIDPGYEGRIFVTIYNPTTEPIEILPEDTIFTVVFHQMAESAEHPYDGPYQHGMTFPEDDVQRLCAMKAPTLHDVIKSVDVLEDTVGKLMNSMTKIAQDMSWIKGLAIALLAGVTIIVFTLILRALGVGV